MRKFLNLLKKEVRELFTKQIVIPLLLVVIVFYAIGRITSVEIKKIAKPMDIGIVDMDGSTYSMVVQNAIKSENFNVHTLSQKEAKGLVQEARAKRLKMIVIIPEGFERNIISKKGAEIQIYSIIMSLGLKERTQKALVKKIIEIINSQISSHLIKEFSQEVNPEKIKAPISSREIVCLGEKIAPGNSDLVVGFIIKQNTMVPVILMLLLIVTSSLIAASIGQEKENKTLETLLTAPVSRVSIILSKMLASLILAILFSGIYLFGFREVMTADQALISTDSFIPKELGLTFGITEYILFGLTLLFTIMATLGISTLIALFAGDVKSAQAIVYPINFLILIPYLLSIYTDPDELGLLIRIFIFIIPFSHSFFSYKRLVLDKFNISIFGIIYLFIFSSILIYSAIKIIKSDRLLTAKLTLKIKRSK